MPDDVTVSEVVVSTNTAKVTGVPEGASLKLAASWKDASDVVQSERYSILAIDSDGNLSLDKDAVVEVNGEAIAVEPELAAPDEGSGAFEVGEDVAIGAKSIPGLVYRLGRGAGPSLIDPCADFGTVLP